MVKKGLRLGGVGLVEGGIASPSWYGSFFAVFVSNEMGCTSVQVNNFLRLLYCTLRSKILIARSGSTFPTFCLGGSKRDSIVPSMLPAH